MNHTGWSPLMFAAVQGRNDILELLVSNGANIDLGGNGPWIKSCLEGEFKNLAAPAPSPPMNAAQKESFFNAAEKGNWDKIKKLLTDGININTRNEEGATVLIIAAFLGHKTLCFRLILAGIDVKTKDGRGFNALMTACECEKEQLDLVAFLIMKGLDINAGSSGGATALMNAAKIGHYQTVKLLISKGADLNRQNQRQVTALIWAADQGHKDIVKLLISTGADVHATTDNGYTALSIAEENNHWSVADILRNAVY
jgi:serine/threonine-protein phosphatase 6 regulatory ankyrin repeat subunit B